MRNLTDKIRIRNYTKKMRDFSGRNLQKMSFENADLSNADFSGSDLRGADFSGADLTGSDLTSVRTGIPTFRIMILFLAALSISGFSGYIAMVAGHTIQSMIISTDDNIKAAGIISVVNIVLFITLSVFGGIRNSFRTFIVPACFFALVIGVMTYGSGYSQKGAFYIVLSLALVAVMFVVGTVARTIAGSLSNTLFIIVGLFGGVFGRSVGGGIGTVIMAISCVQISRRAMNGKPGFETLRRIASYITGRFGTSFRNARLSNTDFSRSILRNSDFSNADVFHVNWGDSKKVNCKE